MELFKQYQSLEEKIHSYFGYVEDWKVIPMDSQTEMYWKLELEDGVLVSVWFGPTVEDVEMYRNDIYTQRFLSKYVYRGEDYTMISVDTHVDGNKFLQIFDNAKEIT
jgi:regulatory protein YycI of two-component signal transduction system YycFG